MGAYLADRYGGDAARIAEIPAPTADEPRYDRVHRVLRRYDEHLSAAERATLTLFSAFRLPVHESAFESVFRVEAESAPHPNPLPEGEREKTPLSLSGSTPASRLRAGVGGEGGFTATSIAALNEGDFAAMIQRLVNYRLLKHHAHDQTYTTHPLIRAHYAKLFAEADRATRQDAHTRIKDYYLARAGETPRHPTLDDLAPLIEAVHHACRAGAYDEAYRIYKERIRQGNRFVDVHQLGAYETSLALMLEFCPDGDTSQALQVSDSKRKSWILNAIGLRLMSLGRLGAAVTFYERGNAMDAELEDWQNASIGYQNLAGLHAHLGALAASADAAREALALARRAENKREERASLAYLAWAAHLRGDLNAAGAAFQQAEALEREIDSDKSYLYSNRAIWHADHLRRTGAADYARRVTTANLEICEEYRWPDKVSMSHRVLGDLEAEAGAQEAAREHYAAALNIARSITYRPALSEALLARGRWAARYAGQQNPKGLRDPSGLGQAFNDLQEALGYAVEGGYRIYEADLRVALAWAHLAAARTSPEGGKSLDAARAEAARAREMSAEMGYHWGVVDAEEVGEYLRPHKGGGRDGAAG